VNPSEQERIAIWKWAYARDCLLNCSSFLDELAAENNYPDKVIRALNDAAIVSYGQPFTSWEVSPKISGVRAKISNKPLAQIAPPDELKTAHDQLIELRHKVVAHKDAIGGNFGKVSPVHILRDSTGFDVAPIQLARLHRPLIDKAKQLCTFYINHCASELSPIIKKYKDSIFARDVGKYELVLDPSADWLKPL
jgi:hypothetical protein